MYIYNSMLEKDSNIRHTCMYKFISKCTVECIIHNMKSSDVLLDVKVQIV